MGTFLAWTAPLLAMTALLGLWRSRANGTRRVCRAMAIITAVGSAAVMAAIVLSEDGAPATSLASAGAMTGILYGLGLWLSVSALLVDEYHLSARISTRPDQRFWDDITRELTSHDSLDTMLLNIAGAFRRDVSGECVHVFKISETRRLAYRTGSVHSSTATVGTESHEEGELLAELAWWASLEDQSAMVAGANGRPILTLPLRFNGTTYAIFLIQNPQRAPRANWHSAAAMVAHTLADWCELTLHRDRGVVAQRMTIAMPALMSESCLDAALNVIATALQGHTEFDYLSVSSLGASRAHEDRATILSGSRRVIESRHRWPVTGAVLQRVLTTGRAVITPDLDMAADDDIGDTAPWERRLGMRSRLIAPICDGDRVVGSITLAHRRFARYSEDDIDLVATISAFLTPWMHQVIASQRVERNERMMEYIRRLEGDTTASVDEAELVRDASRAVDATGLRVYRVDQTSQFLREVAVSERLPNDDSSRQLPLSQLPWHRWALDSRRTLAVDQGDPEAVMNREEADMAMDRQMKTGCLVPIVSNGQPLGVIDVVERRHPDRTSLDTSSKLIIEKLADILARRWQNSHTEGNGHDDAKAICERLKGWSRQVVNPLTSIIGSVELIRHKQPELGAEMIKYLGTIERSATRIHESLMTIIEEAASEVGESAILMPRERWTWSRPSEQSQTAAAEFARPASLSEAAILHTEAMAQSPTIR